MRPVLTSTSSPRPTVTFEPAPDPEVTCIIVTYGTGPIVVRCLSTLTASLAAEEVAAEILVVDNEHRWAGDRTRRLLRLATAGIGLIVPHRNLGFAAANNLAAGVGRSELIAFVNPDVEFDGAWFAPLRAALDRASIASPVLLNPDGSVQEAGHLVADDGSTWPITDDVAPGEVVERPYASAACWLMHRDEFDRLGRFDEVFHPAYYEDADFGFRAARDGRGTVVVGSARVRHLRGGSTTSSSAPDLWVQRELFRHRWAEHLTRCPPPPG